MGSKEEEEVVVVVVFCERTRPATEAIAMRGRRRSISSGVKAVGTTAELEGY